MNFQYNRLWKRWVLIPHSHSFPRESRISRFYLRYPEILSSLSRPSIFTIPTFYLRYPELLSSLFRTSFFAIPNRTSIFAILNIVFFHNSASMLEIWGISLLSGQVTYLLNVSHIPEVYFGQIPDPGIFAIPTFYLHYPELISSLSRTSIFAISNFYLRHPELLFLLSRISFSFTTPPLC